ncbi:MAG: Putative cytochrome C-type biogenesis protein [uncultured Sulfurovum sp.]|uniref:Cytochrome C-type biogenesis protein n=1 Tax=uncultured Sulfurovum sp. TaxID=269237 RepID=A0A6S6T5K9_9BACT|nr:MAG: Putative cytochrome C-type biogenesis protein [uncultured Sulfurovum sp.]
MLKHIFSVKIAVLILFLFGAIVGGATFIENDYGTQTARALIYNAQWFEFFLLYFILLLLYNMMKYKSYKSKPSVFIFHTAFLVIAIGAMITRYIGYEGVMHIREGAISSSMISAEKVLKVHVENGENSIDYQEPILFSSMSSNSWSENWDVNGKEVSIKLVNYLPTATKVAMPDSINGKQVLELMVAAGGQGKPLFITDGDVYDTGKFILAFNKQVSNPTKPLLSLTSKGDGTLQVESAFDIKTLSMLTQKEGELSKGLNDFSTKMLYQFEGNSIVLKEIHEKSIVKYVSNSLKTQGGKPEMATFVINVDGEEKTVDLFSYAGNISKIHTLTVGGVKISMYLGVQRIAIPFSIKLINFDLERYPGSMSPSAYSSDVELIDRSQGIDGMPYKIFMNHVLDHRSYRFFQSSYDQDEKGTILSVNHDPGTWPTYIGYILLTLGMIWNLFDKNGRFQKLLKGARKLQNGKIKGASIAIALMFFMSYSTPVQAAKLPTLDANLTKMINVYPDEVVSQFGRLVVQDTRGRMKPIDTLAHEVIAKLAGKSSIYGVEPSAMMLGMTVNPKKYQNIPMIKVEHIRIAKELGLPEGATYAKFYDFFTTEGEYKLTKQMNDSVRKKPLDKNLYDKELVKVDERLNVAYMIYTGTLLQIYPVPNEINNKWMNPQDAISKLPKKDSEMIRMMTVYLFQGAGLIEENGDVSKFNEAMKLINMYQEKLGVAVMLSQNEISVEIQYNKLGFFAKLVPLYLLVGIILLLAAFINIIKPNPTLKWIAMISWGLMVLGFAIHVASMGMRWYVGGHAPWSNAYESIVFIAASTVAAGLIFARKSPFALGATALLAGVTMGVAHMNFINPEITTLVPVLKSYWLMIHVATIISGDGFLGLGSIVSLVVLILYIMKRGENENIDRSIKELTNIAEMSIIVGLFLMTIGNFLGGVWANESWGRYWGWDSKETWAAVTILIYATILHLRFIPKLSNPFAFNVASLWGYSTVIMTYFGVNYYLSGLHSYAAGAPMPLPDWVIPAVIGLFILTLLAAKSWKNIKIVFILLFPLILWVAGLLLMLNKY